MSEKSNYLTYRGKCKELSEIAVTNDPSLKLIRGHYYCPLWNRNEPHWWTERPDGTIFDPSSLQFPSNGSGIYTPFNGTVECSECGKKILENEAQFAGNYALCSYECYGRLVGII